MNNLQQAWYEYRLLCADLNVSLEKVQQHYKGHPELSLMTADLLLPVEAAVAAHRAALKAEEARERRAVKAVKEAEEQAYRDEQKVIRKAHRLAALKEGV